MAREVRRGSVLSDAEQPDALRQLVKSQQMTPQGKGEAPGCHVGDLWGSVGMLGTESPVSKSQIRFEEQRGDGISRMTDWPFQQF